MSYLILNLFKIIFYIYISIPISCAERTLNKVYKSTLKFFNYLKLSIIIKLIMINNKYYQVIIELLNGLDGKIEGKVKLAKLLYYVDFDFFQYKENGKPITGDTYSALPMGPVPNKFNDVIQYLKKEKIINVDEKSTIFDNDICVYTILNKNKNFTKLDNDEKFIINRVIRKYGKLNGSQLQALTHDEAPWAATYLSKDNDEIDYLLTYYRTNNWDD